MITLQKAGLVISMTSAMCLKVQEAYKKTPADTAVLANHYKTTDSYTMHTVITQATAH